MFWVNKAANIFVGAIYSHFLYSKTAFLFWLLLINILESMNRWDIHKMLTFMSGIFPGNSFQLKYCCNQDFLTLNVGYYPYPKGGGYGVEHCNANINFGHFNHVFVEWNIVPNINGEFIIFCCVYLQYIY